MDTVQSTLVLKMLLYKSGYYPTAIKKKSSYKHILNIKHNILVLTLFLKDLPSPSPPPTNDQNSENKNLGSGEHSVFNCLVN